VSLGVISGIADPTPNNSNVLIAGLAEAFAGSISMGAGAYLSSKAEHEAQEWAVTRERNEVDTIPEVEKEEVGESCSSYRVLYRNRELVLDYSL
jgi:VIT1/CCC1 family predicted Fe2+/Mn2+ transporter